MTEFFEKLWNGFLSYLQQYSFFLDGSYYGGSFKKYFSGVGFFVGAAFVLLIYFAAANRNGIKTFLKTLVFVAVINCCYGLSALLHYGRLLPNSAYGVDFILNASNNIISGFILTLTVFYCYRNYHGAAFLFGLITFAAIPLLNYSVFDGNETLILYCLQQAVLAGFLCLIMSYRRYFYTSWIWFFGFFLLENFVGLVFDVLVFGSINQLTFRNIYLNFFELIPDVIVFAVILVFSIVFEKHVLETKPKKTA